MPNFPAKYVTIDEKDDGKRLDNFLIRTLSNVPKSRIYKMVRSGEVRINKGRAKPKARLALNDVVRIPPVHQTNKKPPVIAHQFLERLQDWILFEDDALLVINKPHDLAVHAGSNIAFGLIEALQQDSRYPMAELAHRIDKGTSGCLLIAKKPSVLKALHDGFRQNTIQKQYLAIVQGKWRKKLQCVNMPLLRIKDTQEACSVRVHPEGKIAISYFEVLQQNAQASLLRVQIETGRTHQIRVHCQYAGHPVVGDKRYGDKARDALLSPSALALHAYQLSFQHPVHGKTVQIYAPISSAFSALLTKLHFENEYAH